MTKFGTQLKEWRGARRLSQLQLAVEAEVSSRHISFLESGRAGPSREMVLHLSEILEVPHANRNDLLHAAGFAPQYVRSALSDTHMDAVNRAMEMLLAQHNPYPAVILDKLWRLVDLNNTAAQLFASAGLAKGDSLLDWTVDTAAARQVIVNWGEVGHHTLIRLRNESRAQGGVTVLDEAAARLASDPDIQAFRPEPSLSPVLKTIYRAGALQLALFSTYATFGGAEDLAISDLKIELMFPATPEAEEILRAL